jgi:hypothetical protein
MLKYQVSWKSVQSEPSCSMDTDGRTDVHDDANSPFSQFWEAPKNIGKLLPIILKYMDQLTEIWQTLGDNHVPPLWRLYFSARIIWQCRRCFSKGPYDVAIISAWSVIVYVLVQVSHIVWQPTELASLRIISPQCACAVKTLLIDKAGRDCWQHATHDSACVPLDKNKWMTHSSWMKIKKPASHLGPDSLPVTVALLISINGMQVVSSINISVL